MIVTAEERQLATIQTLAELWHRADCSQASSLFNNGRMAGYVQAIGLLLDKPYHEIIAALWKDEL